MSRHHVRSVLRTYIEHKNPANLRLHVWADTVAWLALTTALSQVALPFRVPLLGHNLGAAFVVLSFLYWAAADFLVSAAIVALTLVWAWLPFSPWGGRHGWV